MSATVRNEQVRTDPTPVRARPIAAEPPPTREVSLTVEVIAVEGRMIRVTGPQGELVLPIRAKALNGGAPEPGSLVTLRTGVSDTCGEYQVLAWSPVPGLQTRFGRVTTIDAEELRLRTTVGEESFGVNPFAELAEGVAPGAWVGIRVYSIDDKATVLAAQVYPGDVWDIGVLAEEKDGQFVVQGLAGPRCWKGGVGSFSVGDVLEVRGSWDPADGFHARAYTPKVWPQVYSGRLEARESGTLTVTDQNSLSFGKVSFAEPRLCDAACEGLSVGDIVDLDWRSEGGRFIAETLRPHAASKIVVGEIGLRDTKRLRITAKGGEALELLLTPQTVFATQASPGDRVHVVTAGGSGNKSALLVVRE